jgi:uncharacterized protein (TIGR01777 family)
MKNIVIAGGTGLIGGVLAFFAANKNYSVTVLTRRSGIADKEGIKFSQWSPSEGKIDTEVIESADVIINLSGENVADKRWTKKRKEEIIQSRIQSNNVLIDAIRTSGSKATTYISASAIGWYGPDSKETRQTGFKEEAPAYKDFLGSTCEAWEESALKAENLGLRTVILRTGIVLAKEGGALAEFMKPLRSGIASVIGSGNQMISWIHIEDLCRMYLCAIENEKVKGVYNAVSPQPITNKQLVLELAAQKRGKAFIPIHVPSFIIKLMLGEMSIEVLKSTTVSADKIKKAGFQFLYPGIQSAIKNLIKD